MAAQMHSKFPYYRFRRIFGQMLFKKIKYTQVDYLEREIH
jgi:hypothetical protein